MASGTKVKKVIRKVYEPLFPALIKEKVLMIPLKMAPQICHTNFYWIFRSGATPDREMIASQTRVSVPSTADLAAPSLADGRPPPPTSFSSP